jgi:hypothetical protein
VPDRRLAEETRARVDEIGASMVSYTERLDRRFWKLTWALIAMVVIILVSVFAGYGILQGQRWASIRDGCVRTNQQTDATVALLRDVSASKQVIQAAQARYPHVPPLAHRDGDVIVMGPPPGYDGPSTCEEFADGQVGAFRL